MQIVTALLGLALVVAALLDAFQTIILPRRPAGRFRLTGLFYMATWGPWVRISRLTKHPKRRETWFSIYGPLSLILLLVLWAVLIMLGFGFIFYALGSPFSEGQGIVGLRSDLYVSGTTIFTLGIGDVVPNGQLTRMLVILEAGIGMGFLAVVMGYFPVLYSAFSKREVSISLLDARAGSPPCAGELLRRHAYDQSGEAISRLLEEWERWSAELMESHISYPLLCYFRSQHVNQSWLSALVAILDSCSLMIAMEEGAASRQAQLTFAMARHAMVDLAQLFHIKTMPNAANRLTDEGFEEMFSMLCQAGVRVSRDTASRERLQQMRSLYEGYAVSFAEYLQMSLPPWMHEAGRKDNWQTVARLRAETEAVFGQLDEVHPEIEDVH
jgi:hypothetical protein